MLESHLDSHNAASAEVLDIPVSWSASPGGVHSHDRKVVDRGEDQVEEDGEDDPTLTTCGLTYATFNRARRAVPAFGGI